MLQYQKIFLDQSGSQGCRNGLEKKPIRKKKHYGTL